MGRFIRYQSKCLLCRNIHHPLAFIQTLKSRVLLFAFTADLAFVCNYGPCTVRCTHAGTIGRAHLAPCAHLLWNRDEASGGFPYAELIPICGTVGNGTKGVGCKVYEIRRLGS